MPTFSTFKELMNALHQGSRLLNDLFQKRKTVAIAYDDAVETLDGDAGKIDWLIDKGIIERVGDHVELGDAYLRFFEEVLEVNEDINVGTVGTFVNRLRLSIDSYLAADNNARKIQLLRDVRHALKSIANATQRNVSDLRRNVDVTYKQEPNFKIKELRLKDFDEKSRQIALLIEQTEHMLDEQSVFLATADVTLRQTMIEVRQTLQLSAHALIDITAQIIDYLNRIDYQSKLVRKVRQLKYLRDQYMISESTNIREVAAQRNDVWMEPKPKYTTRVSLSFLRNDDAALVILEDMRKRLHRKTTLKSRLAPPIDSEYLDSQQEQVRAFDHRRLFEEYKAQGMDLFAFLWRYRFDRPATEEDRLVLFLQMATQFDDQLQYTDETATENNIEYPIILPL